MRYVVTTQKTVIPAESYKFSTVEKCLEYFKYTKQFNYDSETTGLNFIQDKILTIQLGDRFNQFCIDCTTIDVRLFKELLESKTLIVQNAIFDLPFLFKQGIYPKKVFDTLIAEAIICCGYGDADDNKDIKEALNVHKLDSKYEAKLGLSSLAYKYLSVNMDKSVRSQILKNWSLSESIVKYSTEDVAYLELIYEKQYEVLNEYKEKYGLTQALIDLEMKAVIMFAKMRFNGFTLDKDKYRSNVISVVESALNNTILKLNNYVKDNKVTSFNIIKERKHKNFQIVYQQSLFSPVITNINWSSPEQKLGLLREFIPTLQSTSATELVSFKDSHKIVSLLLEYNKYKKLKDAFGENLISMVNPITNRLHIEIKQILSTGRISMSSPNLSQIPSKGDLGKVIRSCFVPAKKYKIVGGDYSGFELSIIAELSQDPLWINTLNSGGDLHSILCSQTFDIPIEDVNKPFYANPDITYRGVQKTINFGLAYGMSEYKLSNSILVSVDEARDIISKFFSRVPKVYEFLNSKGNFAKTYGYSYTPKPFNRLRFYPKWDILKTRPRLDVKGKWLGEIERAGKNTPIQGCNADIIKLALIYIQQEIETNNWDVNLLLSVYDEIQTEAHESIAEQWKIKQEELMVKAAKTVIKSVPVKVDVKVSDYWQK